MLQHLVNFITPPIAKNAVNTLYHAIVAQARQPAFYQTHAVPDTVDGRFDLLLLHLILVLHRLKDQPTTRQELFDLMFADMDRNLREMGVGDMSVGKRMKPMIAAFYGRIVTYEAALSAGDTALSEALKRNLYRGAPLKADAPEMMANYVRRSLATLEQLSPESIVSGQIEFAAPII